MKVALIQFDTLWENIQENLAYVSIQINQLPNDVDLVVLPEMFTTGFNMNAKDIAEKENGSTLETLQALAVKKQLAIVASWVISENDKYYNRLFFIHPDASYQTYNKRHLFSLAGEEKTYTKGNDKLIVLYKGWNICPLICYDLRFPVYSRIVNQNYDLLIYIASWPDRRINAWDTLLKARAIENMSYVVGVNRCGFDAMDVVYSGHSQAIDYLGNLIEEPLKKQATQIITIDKEGLYNTRSKLAFLNDADVFLIK